MCHKTHAKFLRPRIFDVMFLVEWFGVILDILTVVRSAEKLGKAVRHALENCYFWIVRPSSELFDSFQ